VGVGGVLLWWREGGSRRSQRGALIQGSRSTARTQTHARPHLTDPNALHMHASKTVSKFLVNKDGTVVGRYAPTTTPASLEKEIEKLLA